MEMFRRDSFLIASNWEQSKHPLTDEKINNLWHFHTVVYYSVIERNKAQVPAWINLIQLLWAL